MRIEKKTLNDALRVLGKVVCQTSPVELYRSIRFVGDVDGVMAMATDGVEVVSVLIALKLLSAAIAGADHVRFNLGSESQESGGVYHLSLCIGDRLETFHRGKIHKLSIQLAFECLAGSGHLYDVNQIKPHIAPHTVA